MKIELKSIKFYPSMSEETNCFQASLFVNGKKIAECRNDGRGGCTDIYHLEGCKTILSEVEAYAKTLPSPKDYPTLKMDLEILVDDLLVDTLRAKDRIKFEKKKLKDMEKGFVLGNPNTDGYRFVKTTKPIAELSAEGLARLIEKVKGLLKEDEVILNTNI